MPTLILIRHAKAEAPDSAPSDHDRALTLAGRTSATQLSEILATNELIPSGALVSTALRAQQTWLLMAPVLGDVEVENSRDVYDTDDEGLLELIRAVPADTATYAVVGHEPTISAAAANLAGPGSDTRSLQRVAHGLPTGAAAVLEFDGAWADLEVRSARLSAIHRAEVHY